ncbi:beta-lactamase-like protein [Xylariaceae sp. FL0255]|nr:beta-lactamase-like protein [Xylariaceae sp. FL0255]
MASYDMEDPLDMPICTACGTQYPTERTNCLICDDPRQFTPPTGQSFTSLSNLHSDGYQNIFTPLHIPNDPEAEVVFTSIHTKPKLAIGQRAILIKTPAGNVLWDCVTLLDDDTVKEINSRGGLKAIVISHPHYYTTHIEWAKAFDCPVYVASQDKEWLARRGSPSQTVFLSDSDIETDIQGTKVIRLGGHFPGSLVMLYRNRLLIADTLVTTPSGLGNWDVDAAKAPRDRPPGMNTFVFMWSIPNMIPLPPDVIVAMWDILKKYEFESTHGAFLGMDVIGKTTGEMKHRVLESMQIQIRASGHTAHPLLAESV